MSNCRKIVRIFSHHYKLDTLTTHNNFYALQTFTLYRGVGRGVQVKFRLKFSTLLTKYFRY